MRRLLAVAVLVAAPLIHAQNLVRIGAWNIEWLGFPQNRGAGGPQTPEDLASYIIASRVDVLGLEEITRNGPNDTNRTVTRALEIIRERTGNRWEHVLFDKPNGDANQRIGVAWNTTRARLVGTPFKIPVPNVVEDGNIDATIWERHPHAVKFSFGEGRTDVVVIVLHMKSNRTSTPPPVRKRELEARTLIEKLPQVRTALNDADVILIGDSNILDDQEIAARLFVQAGFRDLNSEDEGTFVSNNPAPFDRTFVPRDDEFNGLDQLVFDREFLQPRQISRSRYRRRFSDHFMIVTPVRVLADDD